MGSQSAPGLYYLLAKNSAETIKADCYIAQQGNTATSVTYGLSAMGSLKNSTSSAVTVTIKVNNVTIFTATLPANSTGNMQNISGSRSHTITKTQSTQTVPLVLTVSSYSDSYNVSVPTKWSYTLNYDSGPCSTVESQTKFYGDSLTLRSGPTLASTQQAGVVFLGWSFDNGTVVTRYSGGASFTDDTYCSANPVTAYMTADYSPYPKITSAEAHRCDYSSPSVIADEGVCAAAVIDYTFGELMSQISFTGKVYSDASCTNLVSNTTVSSNVTRTASSGTATLSGTKTLLLASASSVNLDPNTDYWAKITIQGTYTAPGESSASTTTLQTVIVKIPTAFFTMDVLAGGHGIAFGGPAKQSDVGYLVNYLKAKFLDDIIFESLIGTIQMFGGSTPPNGWLLCDGSAVSRTTYATLYAVIGTTYGTGDGSTTFNLPDLRGRAPIGAGSGTGLTARTLGDQSIGMEDAVVPYHNHTMAHTHNITSGAHQVFGIKSGTGSSLASGGLSGSTYRVGATANTSGNYAWQNTTGNTSTQTGYAGSSGNATGANMQPSAVVNFIICSGVLT